MSLQRTTPQRTVQHFTHDHPLAEFKITGAYIICDGCKTYGSGKTYRCEPCNYDLHEYCATCPFTLSTFLHPQHELTLFRGQQSTREISRVCDICKYSVEGLFYRCKICDFDVHPLCTQLPRHVRHVLHPGHHLEFRLGGASTCMVCHDPCQSWRYRCQQCRFDIHMACISAEGRGINPNHTQASGQNPNPSTSKEMGRVVIEAIINGIASAVIGD